MNAERVAERGLHVVDAIAGRLDGFALVFNKMSREHAGVGHANLKYTRGARIEGVLYELADHTEILKMDPFERAPWNYGRDVIRVEHAEGDTWAWTYFANPAVLQTDLNPTREYLDHLLAGREFLSAPYYAQLLTLRERCV
jgi:hypothetical protein